MLDRIGDFINAVPELRESLVSKYARKEINAEILRSKVERLFTDYIKERLSFITNVYRGRAIKLAYLDVARYQTDALDAAIEWGVNAEALEFLLGITPLPTSTEERLGLDVSYRFKKAEGM